AQSAWTPAVYGRSTGVEIRSAALAKVLISGISAAILLGAALTPLLLPLVYPAADRVTFMALIFVAAAALPGISAMLATSVVASYKQTAYLAGVSISGAVVAIALNFGLIEGFGMAGAGLALFGTGILSAALLVHRAASLESDRIPLATPILIGVAIIALGLVVALISTRGLVVQGFVYVMISLVALRLGIGPVRKLLGYLANTDQPQLESP
ncbi:MAG: hypothetical protein OEX97_13375, partial [Acidimicrobiia bacterium]|nr:hypothetical protein [Acidimicrobiia bacterium]